MRVITIVSLSLIFLISFTSALSIIEIKTLPSQTLYITPIRAGSDFSALQPPELYISDAYGDLKVTFNLESYPFDLAVKIMQGDKTLLYEKIRGDFQDGEVNNITVAPEGIELLETPQIETPEDKEPASRPEDVPSNESEELLETEQENATINPLQEKIEMAFVSGYAVFKETDFSKKVIYSILSLLILLTLIVITFITIKKVKKKLQENVKPNFNQEKNLNKGEGLNQTEKGNELGQAEKELKKAQRKVNSIKNKPKIDEVKKRLIEDEKELIRLRNEK